MCQDLLLTYIQLRPKYLRFKTHQTYKNIFTVEVKSLSHVSKDSTHCLHHPSHSQPEQSCLKALNTAR